MILVLLTITKIALISKNRAVPKPLRKRGFYVNYGLYSQPGPNLYGGK
jgi:hypothetical protein